MINDWSVKLRVLNRNSEFTYVQQQVIRIIKPQGIVSLLLDRVKETVQLDTEYSPQLNS